MNGILKTITLVLALTMAATGAGAATVAQGKKFTRPNFSPIYFLDDSADLSKFPTALEGAAPRLRSYVGAKPQSSLATAAAQISTGNGISFHGGPVMGDTPISYYVIWYGNWSTAASNFASAQPIIEGALRGIGGTAWSNTLTTYSTTGTQFGQTIQNFATSTVQSLIVNFDVLGPPNSPYKTNLSTSDISDIVMYAVLHGGVVGDKTKAQFIVLSSDDVTWSIDGTPNTWGYPNGWCGMHNHTNWGSHAGFVSQIKWAIVANPVQEKACISGYNYTRSPNGYVNVDAMVNILAHEVAETITDPLANAWYDDAGNEVGDKCSFDFGSPLSLPDGSHYNQTWGGMRFLVQKLWINSGGGSCVSGM
jgi:hypothetical protein